MSGIDVPLRRPMTRTEFLDWSAGQDGRHAFVDGEPRAMVGGTLIHNRIAGNLYARLRGGACVPFIADAGIATGRDNVRYPDVVVTCTGVDGRERLAPEPVLACEVVGESAARVDRLAKLREYHAVASIRRYVLIEQAAVALTVLFRDGDGAWSAASLGEGDALALPELGVEIPLAEIHDGLDLAGG